MDKSYMDRGSYGGYQCARLALRVAAVLFTVFIIVCVAVGVTLIFTQKPVDLSASWSPSRSNHVQTTPSPDYFSPTKTTPISLRTRKKFPSNYRKFTFADLIATTPIVKASWHTQWLPNGAALLHGQVDPVTESETLMMISPESNTEREFLRDSDFPAGYSSERIKFSANGRYAALYSYSLIGFRHSKEATYRIARVSNGRLQGFPRDLMLVGPKGTGTENIQEFTWNPDPNSNSFVFVYGNALYYQEDPEVAGSAKQLTQNGSDYVRYGVADWLYEEDVLGTSVAHWWSPSGRFLSYIKFDDTDVNKVFIKKYYQGVQYPEYKSIPYPKAGVTQQPKVKLYLWNRETQQRVVISPPEELKNQTYYIFSIGWVKPTATRGEKLLTVWSNRRQNVIYFTLCDERDCVMTLEQPFTLGPRRLWALPPDFADLPSSSNGFFALLPTRYADDNIYNHVAHIQLDNDGIGRITATHGGPYDVLSIVGYDRKTDTISYSAMGGGIASSRFYRVDRASTKEGAIHCLSCAIPECESSIASVSPTGNRAFLSCRGAFKDTRLYFMTITNPHDDAHVGLMMPPRLDPSQKYPLFLNVYGGPHSYMNNLETPWDFLLYLCSSEQMIIAYVDGRGTGQRGWNLKEPVYERLGVPETEDQIEAVKEILNRYDFIDKNSVTVFGWSYGGFISTHIAVKDKGDVFRCAMAVAPVTDYTLYDSAYTERYMGYPEENRGGYNNSLLLDKVQGLANVSYLLAHGEADDNVHYQHSALLSQSLQMANIHFTQLVYTNQDHAMISIRHHLYEEFIQFLTDKCINKD